MKGKTGKGEIGMGKEKVQEYNAQGSEAQKEADDTTPGFKKGGAAKKAKKMVHGGHAEGKAPKKNLGRKARASGGRSPYSSAMSASGGASEDEGGKREVNGPGAEIEIPTFKRGGKAK